MFIVFGWESSTKVQESLLNTYCQRCDKNSNWQLWKETEWATLFFIKILPLSHKYHLQCECCRDGLELPPKLAKLTIKPEHRTPQLHDTLVTGIHRHQNRMSSSTQH